MENLIRIKLNPKRGGVVDIDFKRPCFRIYDWECSDVEIWFSDDNGLTWHKLENNEFRFSYDFELKHLYVALEFDIDSVSQVAFFAPGWDPIGLGYAVTRYDRIPLGWKLEGPNRKNIPVGANWGSPGIGNIGAGYSIEGASCFNLSVGWALKSPDVSLAQIGYTIATPHDTPTGVGYTSGIIETGSIKSGMWILGLGEYKIEMLVLDDAAFEGLMSEAAWHKQKNLTLNGTTPGELD